MDHAKDRKTVSCIVAAYNEGPRIGETLAVLTQFPFDEIIVASDGSSDNTCEVARSFAGVKVLEFTENRGKATVMNAAVQESTSDILFFSDADLVGFAPKMIEHILEPVAAGRVDMCIGMRNRLLFRFRNSIEIFPWMGGERAVTRTLWNKIPEYYVHQYRIEAALNFYAKYYGNGLTARIFKDLTQIRKEQKLGFLYGWIKKLAMLGQVILAELRLQNTAVPHEVSNIRKTLRGFVVSTLFGFVGFLLICVALVGPQRVTPYFIAEMQQDSHAYLSQFVVWFVETFSATTIEILGIVLLLFNSVFVLQHLWRLGSLLRHSPWTLKDVILKRGENEKTLFY